MNKLISVVVPVYNMEKYIVPCINSILSQDYKNIEVILVDDGSTDSTRSILSEFSEKDSRVKLVFQDNQGVSWATYNGYKEAGGDYICFSDHDDVFLPKMLSHLEQLLADEIDISCCSRVDLHDEELLKYRCQGTEKISVVSGREALENTIKPVDYNLQLPLWGRIYRKSFLDSIDFLKYADLLPTLFMVDIFIMPQILLKARKVVYTNMVCYIHREVKTSISRGLKLGPFYYEQIDSFPLLLTFYQNNQLGDLYVSTLRDYANSCLLRLWYKVKTECNNDDFRNLICKKIESRFSSIYKELQKYEHSFIYRLSYTLFYSCKSLWKITVGMLYFKVIRKIK